MPETQALAPLDLGAASAAVAKLLEAATTAVPITYAGSVTDLHGPVLALVLCGCPVCRSGGRYGYRVCADLITAEGGLRDQVRHSSPGSYLVGQPEDWTDEALAAVAGECQDTAVRLAARRPERAAAANGRAVALREEITRRGVRSVDSVNAQLPVLTVDVLLDPDARPLVLDLVSRSTSEQWLHDVADALMPEGEHPVIGQDADHLRGLILRQLGVENVTEPAS